jgi:hypothetical protein
MTSTMQAPFDVDQAAAQLLAGPVTMTADVAAQLRAPFAAEHMGKLPKITCPACRGSKRNPNPMKVCGDHRKSRCPECRNWITGEHMHLDYVGHAEVTDRLLTVDPLWTWEPMAFDEHGLPKADPMGGLWIRLTVAGVTRIGYGSADGKSGGDAVKEIIGDAIRNAAMRFGVALDLWGAKFKAAEDDAEAKVREANPAADVEDDPESWEAASPAIGRGEAPVDQPRTPARPVSREPQGPAYNPALFTLGEQRIRDASTLAELDLMAANIDRFAASGEISQGEAGRLRMKLGDKRDQLRAAPADGPPEQLPDAIAAQARTTAQQ